MMMMTSLSEDTPAHVFEHVMVDIETMSLHRGKALILSVGMIEFDPTGGPTGVADLRIGSRCLLIPSFLDQLMKGRRIDPGTQDFWCKQSPEASAHWRSAFEGGWTSVPEVCRLITDFCKGKKVWAKGPQFDLANLEGLAEDFGQPEVWHYQAPRDVRTFVEQTPQTRLVPIGDALDIPGVPHEPIYDCISQAWQVWSHWPDGGVRSAC